ncbi:hypothetical protein MVEN_01093500 [Mycena venus]|uniref:Uncharacterized protein n=1 Tax=Mycena venus TaxID=2733690 RepID=A0A8H6Y7G1_9AGAR|nr:hypothetical protein MVEN_01093500 [Mycena venus]
MLELEILTCGAEDPLGDIYQDGEPIQPHFLPIPPERSPPPPPSRKRKRSNGCGKILHYGAIVSPNNMWRAAEVRGGGIVPLEDDYFPKAVQKRLLFGWKPCGCVRTGVGCALCGNTLGALFTPCRLHQESEHGTNYYSILPSAVSPPIPPYVPPSSRPVPRAVRPLPAPPPPNRTSTRHPTSLSPEPRFYADFTPTPSPEIVPAALPALGISELMHGWELMDDTVSVVDENEEDDAVTQASIYVQRNDNQG